MNKSLISSHECFEEEEEEEGIVEKHFLDDERSPSNDALRMRLENKETCYDWTSVGISNNWFSFWASLKLIVK